MIKMKHVPALAFGLVLAMVLSALCRAVEPTTAPTTASTTARSDTIRIACVGDSITEGFTIDHPEANGYPADLNRILGDNYTVKNFGAGGTTCLLKGDHPFINDFRHFWEKSAEFKPNLVILMIGTNDSKPLNFAHKEEFAHDLGQFVDHYLNLETKPQVYLCMPAPAYNSAYDINNSNIEKLIPLIRQVAVEKKLPLIDVNAAMNGHPTEFSDGIHPNADGAKRIAETVAKVIAKNV